jgi:Methyltransferase FkbM domain
LVAAHINSGRQFIPNEQIYDFRARPWTITALLDKHCITQIDFMSIDLEGFEMQALQGLDFTRVRPTWLLVKSDSQKLCLHFSPLGIRLSKNFHIMTISFAQKADNTLLPLAPLNVRFGSKADIGHTLKTYRDYLGTSDALWTVLNVGRDQPCG